MIIIIRCSVSIYIVTSLTKIFYEKIVFDFKYFASYTALKIEIFKKTLIRKFSKMDQKSISFFLHRQGFSAVNIHKQLVDVLGTEASSYSTATYYIRQCQFPKEKVKDQAEAVPDDFDCAILVALEDYSFSSVRELAKLTYLPVTTVYRRLTSSLGFVVKHLRWVPHVLNYNQISARITLSRKLLTALNSIKEQGWQYLLILDESWFYLSTDYNSIWLQDGELPPERERKMINSKKLMVTIVWNPLGFHLIDVLPKGQTFNAAYYIEISNECFFGDSRDNTNYNVIFVNCVSNKVPGTTITSSKTMNLLLSKSMCSLIPSSGFTNENEFFNEINIFR
jgi:hypothetical protein